MKFIVPNFSEKKRFSPKNSSRAFLWHLSNIGDPGPCGRALGLLLFVNSRNQSFDKGDCLHRDIERPSRSISILPNSCSTEEEGVKVLDTAELE